MNDIWNYSWLSPPSDEQFAEIGSWLIDDVSRHLEIDFQTCKQSVEPQSWFHANIRGRCTRTLFPITYHGILVCGFRDNKPYVDVVLLAFAVGIRIRLVTGETILTLHRTQEAWSNPCWERDTYDEWHCDRLPNLQDAE